MGEMKGTKRSQDGIDSKPHEKKYRKIRYQEEKGEREMWSIRGSERGGMWKMGGTVKEQKSKTKRERK